MEKEHSVFGRMCLHLGWSVGSTFGVCNAVLTVILSTYKTVLVRSRCYISRHIYLVYILGGHHRVNTIQQPERLWCHVCYRGGSLTRASGGQHPDQKSTREFPVVVVDSVLEPCGGFSS